MSVSSRKICPAVTRSMVEIQLRRVVLPLPEAPIMAVNSPFSTEKEMSFTAFVRLDLLP